MSHVEATLGLLSRWLDRGDRDDLIVALDGLSEMGVHLTSIGWNNLQVATCFTKQISRKKRAEALASIVWDLVHQLPHQFRPSAHELRTLLALALQVRQQISDPQRIVGGDRGRINLTGLLWWAGLSCEPEAFRPRIETIARFVNGGSSDAFRQDLLDDVSRETQRRQRNVASRERRERRRQLRVYDYDTRDLLGIPTPQLVRRSLETETGVVPAYLDRDGRWEYVQDVDHYRHHLHVDVVMVYVA